MTLEQELQLSYYREVADISPAHHVRLVQHVDTRHFYVKKTLQSYHADVFRRLQVLKPAGIPQIHELIRTEDSLIVIEDYIHGESLQSILDRRHRLPQAEAVSLVCQLCDLLQPLHQQDPPIMHRDIKPANLMLSADGVLYLIDFDAARSLSSASRDTELIGTHGYAAPEQYGFAQSTPATDCYAVGVLLNVLLTGELPSVRTVGGKLGAVIRKCTSMDAADRYTDVEALAWALHHPGRSKKASDSWRLPGFRNENPWKKLLFGMYYVLTAALSLSMTGTNAQGEPMTGLDLTCNKLAMLLFFLLPILILGNYHGLHDHLPWKNRPRLCWLPRLVLAVFFALLPIFLLVLLENLSVL